MSDIKTAVSEAVTNCVVHAYPDKNGEVFINVKIYKDKIYIQVMDKGVGIKDIEQAIQPFFTTKPKGTGLGTCLSKEIIDSHNGTIKYESEKNKGTKVLISLPLKN